MKKFLLMAVVAFGMLATACSKDEVAQPVAEKSTVTFSVAAPELATRAHGDGLTATQLSWAVYDKSNTLLFQSSEVTVMSGLKATVEIPFVNGMAYNILFWAEAPESPYSVNWTNLEVGYTNAAALVSNSEKYDAFYCYFTELGEVTGPVTKTVELKRPFAQLNIITNDHDDAVKSGLNVSQVSVEISEGCDKFNLASGEGIKATAGTKITFGNATKVANDHLAVNYLFTGGEKSLVNVTFAYTDGDLTKGGDASRSMEFASVPVQRNYRTNIVGSLLTSEGKFNIEIKPGFDGEPGHEVLIWDGKTLVKPEFDPATKTYTISSAAEFAWLSALTNGTLPATMRSENTPAESISGHTLILDASLDFGGNELKPIAGLSTLKVNGNNNTISNLSIIPGENYAALFHSFTGEIKNLNLKDIKLVNENNDRAAALVGAFYGGTIENVNIENVEIKGAQKLTGLIALMEAHNGEFVVKNCTVKDINISATKVRKENGNGVIQAAALIGYITAINSNITVEGCKAEGTITINDESPTAYPTDESKWGYYNHKFIGSIRSRATKAEEASTITFTNNQVNNTLIADPVLMVSPRASEYFGDCTTYGFSYLTNTPANITIDGVPFVYKTESQKAFEAALANGGEVKLENDVEITAPVVVAEGVTATIDLNGKTLTGLAPKSVGAVLKNEGTLTITGGTISSTGANGGSAIQNNGTLTVEDATLNGAPNANGSWPSYTVNNTGVMTVNNVKITSHHGAVASYGDGAVVTLNNSEIDMAGIPGFTSHGIYTYNNGKVVVNGGTYANKATDQNASGASVINGAVEVNDGSFSGRIENYYGTPVLKGGTYSVKPNNSFVADGYHAIKSGDNYVVVPNTVNGVASTPIIADENLAGETYEGEFFVNPINDALYFDNWILSGDATINITRKYGAIILEGVKGNLNGDVIVVDHNDDNSVMILENCDFTLNEGKKLIRSTNTIYQVFMANITINGVKLTNENAGQYLENVGWFQVVEEI